MKTLKEISKAGKQKFDEMRLMDKEGWHTSLKDVHDFYLSAFTEVLEGLKRGEIEVKDTEASYSSLYAAGVNKATQELNDKIKRIMG